MQGDFFEEERQRARELGLKTEFIGCIHCANCQVSEGNYYANFCEAPELKEHLAEGSITLAQAVRDLRGLCGPTARWFKVKP